jgi:hypothetical protein
VVVVEKILYITNKWTDYFNWKTDILLDVFHSLVTDVQNANEKWHTINCDERSLDSHNKFHVFDEHVQN